MQDICIKMIFVKIDIDLYGITVYIYANLIYKVALQHFTS